MKVAIVSASDTVKHNRMDAGFFVAIDKVKDDLNQLMETMSGEEVKEKLLGIKVNPRHLDFLRELVRGSATQKTMSAAIYHQVVNSDPHAALALIKANQDLLIERITREAEDARRDAEQQAASLTRSLKP